MGGDCFGDAVNVAARLLDHAGDNETLVTDEVFGGLPSEQQQRFRSLDWMHLRGRAEPVHVHVLGGKRASRRRAPPRQFGAVMPPRRARRHPPDLAATSAACIASRAAAGGAGAQPAERLLRRRLARLAPARAHRLARRRVLAGRPQLQRHLRALRRRRRGGQPAARHLHAARQRRHRPGRLAGRRQLRPIVKFEVRALRRHAAASTRCSDARARRVASDALDNPRPCRLRRRTCAAARHARAHRRPAGQPRHAGRTDAGGAAPLPARVPVRPARGRDPAPAVVADPARHHPEHAAGQVGSQVRHHLDRRRLAAGGVDAPSRPTLLQGYLGERGTPAALLVRHAMRYGQPVGRQRCSTR